MRRFSPASLCVVSVASIIISFGPPLPAEPAASDPETATEEQEDGDGVEGDDEEEEEVPVPISLTGIAVPRDPRLGEFIRDEPAAIALGKLLFWDMQVGSDGQQACASCHFNAGADSRAKNQLNPGRPSLGDTVFGFGGPNVTVTAADFPFHQLSDPSDRGSPVLRSRDEVMSSQGVTFRSFQGIAGAVDAGQRIADAVFNVGGVNVRRVEPRNAPTVINAAFNDRNFWDGRAQNEFNGVNPFGTRDPNAAVFRAAPPATSNAALALPGLPTAVPEEQLQPFAGLFPPGVGLAPGATPPFAEASPPVGGTLVTIELRDSSLASQAVGPVLSNFEMSWDGRTWPDVGKKLLSLRRPLADQRIHPDDSVLAAHSSWPNPGARTSYAELVRRAFRPEWWDARVILTVTPSGVSLRNAPRSGGTPLAANEYTPMMYNFSLFFGLAVQAYEATLVSDDTPFDRYVDGDAEALGERARHGLALFFGHAKCANCHGGPLFTDAWFRNVQNQPLERMIMGNGEVAVYDNGFYNIGVRPTEEDLGVGGVDPFGLPLSNTGLAELGLFDRDNVGVQPGERIAVRGAFKTPGLRNVALTAPYMHNGGEGTLRQVVEFYNRGGNFQNRDDIDPDIAALGLSSDDIDALVAFLESLTDERVPSRRAPFDHPELRVPNGARGNARRVVEGAEPGVARDDMLVIDAVGRNGGVVLPRFLE